MLSALHNFFSCPLLSYYTDIIHIASITLLHLKKSGSKLLISILLFNILLFIQYTAAVEDDASISHKNDTSEIQAHTNTPSFASRTFSYADVYTLVLNLDIAGNIKIVAIDNQEEKKDTISVALEKFVIDQDSSVPDSYLQNITISGVKEDGVLEIKAQLPADASTLSLENGSESKIESNIERHLQLNYAIKTPPDISIQLNVNKGNVFVHHVRGKIEINTEMGDIHLDETSGNYQIETQKGRIHGKILFTPGENSIKTNDGSINLTVLDELAAQVDLTAKNGVIQLHLPENYSADIELDSEKQHYIVNVPSEIEENKGAINAGGPLLRLTATDTISILRNPWSKNGHEDTEKTLPQEVTKNRAEMLIPSTEYPPSIDGNLTEKAWFNAEKLSTFKNPQGSDDAENLTDVHLMWDSDHLYIGGRIHLKTYQIPSVSQTQRDSPIWVDDCIEILIDMNPETEAYAHLVLNPIGGLFDQRVREEGYPNFRFAPNDIKRLQIDDSTDKFKGDSTWDSKTKIATKIYATYWSFEIAYPLNDGENNTKNQCLLNVHRKAIGSSGRSKDFDKTLIREFSYWIPMYDDEFPWWPHWKQGMGLLKLVKTQPTVPGSLDATAHYEVKDIEIIDNLKIPTGEMKTFSPFSPGDSITNEQISWMLTELEYYDEFKDAQIEILVSGSESTESTNNPESSISPMSDITHAESNQEITDEKPVPDIPDTVPLKVTLQIKVAENPLNYAERILIRENKSFPSLFIREWFDLTVGYIAEAEIKLKQQMIADFYVNRGYLFAEVNYEFEDDILQINVNEGYLDEIRFTGNRRIPETELNMAIGIDKESVFYETLAETSINKMSDKLSKNSEHFKSILAWNVQSEGGRNILLIEIEEQPSFKPGWYPIVGFNRIHGFVLGAGGNLSTDFTGDEQVFGTLSGGFASRILNYSFGIEKSFFNRNPLAIGLGFFKLSDISNNAFRDFPVEPNLTAAAYGTDSANYYQRDGQQYWMAQSIGNFSMLRAEITMENHSNLSKSTDWSYYERKRIKRGNARIDKGRMNSIAIGYTFDTRDEKSVVRRPQFLGSNLVPWPNDRTKRGWRGNIGVDIAGRIIGSDFKYNLYRFDVVRYTPIYKQHHFNIRVSGHIADAPLPSQRLLYLGGAATLRGYDFNAFAGDKRLLVNIEYRMHFEAEINTNPDVILGTALYTFMDTGQIWWHDENPISEFAFNELKTSVGVGISFFLSPPDDLQPLTTAFEVAVPINIDKRLRTSKLIWRLERMF